MRALAAVAFLAVAAGCGGGRQGWPDCLRVLGAQHVRVADDRDLGRAPKVFAATRAAAVNFSDGVVATIIVSRTHEAADAAALALRSRPSVINAPGPETALRPSAVRRRGTTTMQWFGPRDPRRENTLLECAAR